MAEISFEDVTADIKGSFTDGLETPSSMVYTGLAKPGKPVFCHNQRPGAINESCAAVPVGFYNISLLRTWANGTVDGTILGAKESFWSDSDIQLDIYSDGIANAMQFLLAVTRLDMSNVLSNNFLAHLDVINATIQSPSRLYYDLMYRNGTLRLDTSRPAVIASQYLCHFPQRKSLGSAIISVLVATLSMFGSGWAAFLLVATYFEKRNIHKVRSI
ncbi:hypothetical protein FRB94_013032 [Tulasnella sp. JGI-2019a]|nr:hypothetical protein FRB94_013032 [Tulasnella sp. JGI-2019a]